MGGRASATPDPDADPSPDDQDLDVALGRAIRNRRTGIGMSLRDLATATDLSPSFISQLERGLARPRITSLHRIARVLGTSAQALLSTGERRSYSLVRRTDQRTLDHDEQLTESVRSLVVGDRPITALEFRGVPSEFGQYYEHPGEELYLVISGQVEIDLDGEFLVLSGGDCLCYDGRIPHRGRSLGSELATVYLVTTREDV